MENTSSFLSRKTLLLALVALGVLLFWKNAGGATPDSKLYQVVLLSNDQAFYGKLQDISGRSPYLEDVYYLNPQAPEVDRTGRQIGGSKFTVVKRGIDEIHQPTNRLYFVRENIVYWENVGPESLVARGIKADKEYRSKQAEAAKK